MRTNLFGCAAGMFAAAGVVTVAAGQMFSTTFGVPSRDRWNYGFNGQAGSETEGRVFSPFGASTENQFDNRDSEVILGWDTTNQIPSGQGTTHYRVRSARVTAWTSRDNTIVHDPTYDAVATYFPMTDAQFTPDVDAGRPIELNLVGYKNGFTLLTWQENSPYGGPPFAVPNKGFKNAFAAQYEPAGSGIVREISNNVDERIEARPLAVGVVAGLAPGATVPVNTPMVFEIDVCSPDAQRYLREGLNAGRVHLALSSLATVIQQSNNVPAFHTKENALAGGTPARLELDVCVSTPADWDCSGVTDATDIFTFLDSWFARCADFDATGTTDATDIFLFLDAWFAEN